MNAPTKVRCTELIRLCTGLDFFPSDKPVRDLLIATLYRVAASDEHATRIIENWLEREHRAPLVADIVALSSELNRTPVQTVRTFNTSCEVCRGSGWKIVSGPYGFTGAMRCPYGCFVPSGSASCEAIDRRALGAWYRIEQDEAVERKKAFLESRPSSRQTRLSDRDIDQLRQRQDGARMVSARDAIQG
jgi:hypothetical protein